MSKVKIKTVEFKSYRGLAIRGNSFMDFPDPPTHLGNISWLTASVESCGRFGTVMNYDGTGMTAGIHQAIAVYPRALADNNKKNDQGPLWKLLSKLDEEGLIGPIKAHLHEYDIAINSKCEARYITTGKLVSGKKLREVFCGDKDGYIPLDGKAWREAVRWIKEFNSVFSKPKGFNAQLIFGEEHFIRQSKKKLRFCSDKDKAEMRLVDLFYNGVPLQEVVELPPHFDLAMSMYFSHSVNAPGAALKKLCKKVVDKVSMEDIYTHSEGVSRRLIKALGDTSFARWDDDLKNGRYQRTRFYAKRHWPFELFTKSGVMPKNL